MALTIDSNTLPYRILSIGGTVRMQIVDGVLPEYVAAAERYLGPEQARGWLENVRETCSQMVRITIQLEWVGLLDFNMYFPSAVEPAMEAATITAY